MIGRPAAWAGNPVRRGGRRFESLTARSRRLEAWIYLAKKRMTRDLSAQVIQKAWFSHADKMIFQLLKLTICAAEFCVTYDILKKVSPLEAKLVKDPSMKCKVRFRFSGERFPPFIVFKIFLHTEGRGYKYFSGRNLLKPSSEAVVDACKMMGKNKFYHQVLEDEHLFQKLKVTDEIDIVTMQDYMQYSSLLDEIPASSGGRNNGWRKLSLENIPRTMIMYDIVDYAESGVISNRLQKEMKCLSQKPKTEEMRQQQLRIVSEIRCPSFLSIQPSCRPYQKQTQVKHLGRRSKQAQMKVEKMKKAYLAKEKKASEVTEPKMDTADTKQRKEVIFSTPSFSIVKINEPMSDDELEKGKKDGFSWYQDLLVRNPPSC
ncbi:PREDICTED: putative uncharacterized protein CXorf58 homolog [Propithecus coquereli]|uniref:putative uncharacterized protein CXorf58 homolog n=1 Tax=Propithecus coquereli TaxID=379532 RepID=UPI00063F9C15|nr:PREDICTED: putative uncharacterized protein CXorf58 homolog [Propithecus coquereli]